MVVDPSALNDSRKPLQDMTVFSEAVRQYWRTPFMGQVIYRDHHLSLVIHPALEKDERVTILHSANDRHTSVALMPDVAAKLRARGLTGEAGIASEARLREGLREIGIVMHGADNLYYLPQASRDAWLAEARPEDIRRLNAQDAASWAAFERQASEQDLEAAQIDLEDWAVFGVFGVFGQLGQSGQLLCAASIYPWGDSSLADVGILTLASARGTGCAKRLLRTVGCYAMERGYELQYRSQWDNQASNALARAAGLALWGSWEIPTPDDHG